MFLKNRNRISKIKRSKVTDYAALKRGCVYKKIHYLALDLDPDPKVNVTQNVVQFPLHCVIYAPAKFAVAKSKGLGRDAFTRNMTKGRIDVQTN